MAETRELVIVIAAAVLIGIVGLALVAYVPQLLDQSEVVVDQYRATWYPNGTLVEEYVYDIKVSQRYRMLYRDFDDVVSLSTESTHYISVESILAPPGMVSYVKDNWGDVWVSPPYDNDMVIVGTISSLAEDNEAGCYDPSRLDAGTYTVSYVFRFHPPVQSDASLVHLNVKLASTHIPYSSVTIFIEGANYIQTLYPHPPTLKMTQIGNSIELQGSAAKDELLEFEMLLSRDVLTLMDAFDTPMSDVSTPTQQANWSYSFQYYAAVTLRDGAQTLVIAYPLLFLVVYYLYGREEPYTVPNYLSFVPNKERAPWLVNLVFKDDAMDFDVDGFYATLLDLHLKNKIRITQDDGGLSIQVIDPNYGDPYERRALEFLQGLAEDGVVRTKAVNARVKGLNAAKQYSTLVKLQSDYNYLTTTADRTIADQFVASGTGHLVIFAAIPAVLFFASLVLAAAVETVPYIAWEAGFTSVVLFVQSLAPLLSPAALFGRWTGTTYQEKLEWDAFKRFLSDLALMRQYAPADVSMWGEWLAYGTALGVGDKVSQAMKQLNVPLEEAAFMPMMPMMFRPIFIWSVPSTRRGGGGFRGGFGGGFGVGGGFGGGGGGVR